MKMVTLRTQNEKRAAQMCRPFSFQQKPSAQNALPPIVVVVEEIAEFSESFALWPKRYDTLWIGFNIRTID